MPANESKLKSLLNQRSADNSYRRLKYDETGLIDFSSNDYLGLARSPELKQRILDRYQSSLTKNGATGSRLLTGSNPIIHATETFLSERFQSETGLFFSSGYMANLAFFSAVPQKGDTVLYDELSHACIKDGLRLGLCKRFSFRHNDLVQLEDKLKRATGTIYIVCESIYSMDGDFAPLNELCELAEKYEARLIVDEAHSTGTYGEAGTGLVNHLGLSHQVYAVIYTFGKAMGLHGAFLSCSEVVREFLINFSRPFIYTTAPGDFESISITEAFGFLSEHITLQQQLRDNITFFQKLAGNTLPLIESNSAIQAVLITGNEKTKAISQHLNKKGLDVRPILSPTVKPNEERLRVCLHSFNTQTEIDLLVGTLQALV